MKYPFMLKSKIRLTILFAILISILWLVKSFFYTIKEGDIVFQSLHGGGWIKVIEGVSNSSYSHCGLVVKKENGELYVREAIGSVKDTPLKKWISRGKWFDVDVYRLKNKYSQYIQPMINQSINYLKLPYDGQYTMDDQAIYCSELVFKAYRDATSENLGKLEKLRDLNWKPFAKQIMQQSQSKKIPLDQVMITPASLSKAYQLYRVW